MSTVTELYQGSLIMTHLMACSGSPGRRGPRCDAPASGKDSLGVSEAERIRVTYAAQGYKPGVPVMQLSVENLDAPKQATVGRDGR